MEALEYVLISEVLTYTPPAIAYLGGKKAYGIFY